MKSKAYSYIRMSTPDQLHGDSRRRQLAKTAKYAEEHGLELVDRFNDLGVSAYRGKNAELGALRHFINQIDDGTITKGSYLIVESMDRLSRDKVLKALGLLSEIVSKGIAIVTLDDGQTYSEATLEKNQFSLVMALGAMARAHEESRRKSGLLSDTWEEKKRLARTEHKVMTRRMPAWLELGPAGKIVPIKHRAEVVREIFLLIRDGWGAYSVARQLNERGEEPWSKRRRAVWRESYIKKIIASRTVLGEYHPHKLVDDPTKGKIRVPDGLPVLGYYPAVVTERLFRDAQAAMNLRRTGGRGRKGARYSNLFTGLLRCQCGGGYRYIDKGASKGKGAQFLQCSIAFSKGPCRARPFHYHAIEDVLLKTLMSLDLHRVLGHKSRNIRLAEKKEELAKLQDDKVSVDARIRRLMDVAQAGDAAAPYVLLTEIKTLDQQSTSLQSAISEVELQIDQIQQIDPKKHSAQIKKLISEIRAEDGTPKNELARRALAAEIQRLVQRIDVIPNVRYVHEAVTDDRNWKRTWGVKSERELDKRFRDFGFEFLIVYRNGNRDHVDPLKGSYLKRKTSLKEKNIRFTAGT